MTPPWSEWFVRGSEGARDVGGQTERRRTTGGLGEEAGYTREHALDRTGFSTTDGYEDHR